MECCEIKNVSFEDLKSYTEDFSEENFITDFQFGKVYRGKIGKKETTVKIWTLNNHWSGVDNKQRFEDELHLQDDTRLMSHPFVAKMLQFSTNGKFPEYENRELKEDPKLGVVYDLNSRNTLQNFVQQDDFTWLQRMKVAYDLARLLSFLHNSNSEEGSYEPYLVLNLGPSHIMLDQDYKPILYDFGLFSGGVLLNKNPPPSKRYWCQRVYFHGLYGYSGYDDLGFGYREGNPKDDIFSFGVILINLITKKVFIHDVEDENDAPLFLYDWAIDEYKRKEEISGVGSVSLVNACFKNDLDFETSDAIRITKILMSCIEKDLNVRVTSKMVVQELEKLLILQRHNKSNIH